MEEKINSTLLKRKEEEYQKNLKDYIYQQKEIKRLTDIANRFRYKPTKAKMALSKLKQIEHMTIIDKPQSADTKTFHYNFDPLINSSREVLKVEEIGGVRFKGKMPQVLKTLYQNRGIIKYLLSNPDEALIQDVEDQWCENESQSLCLDKWFGLMQQVFDENNELKDIDLKELFVLWQ